MTRNASLLAACAALLAIAAGCGPSTRRENLSQWASSAAASSTSTTNGTDFTAAQATGAPDVTGGCSDNPNAWAPATANGGVTDTLDVTFDRYVFVQELDVYQSYNPGAIVQIDLMAQDGSTSPLVGWYQDPSGDFNPTPTCPAAEDVFVVQSNDPGGTADQYNQARIYIDENLIGDANGDGNPANDYAEIDAVQMKGDELVR